MKFKDLLDVKKVLDQYKVPFFLAYGTCLGAYRDGDFLPDDDDIDLVITEQITLETRKAIGWMLYDLGFKTQGISFNVFGRMEPQEIGYNGTEKTGIICCERNIKFTIFFFYKEMCDKHGEEYVCIPKLGAVKLIASPVKFYKKPETIKFHKTKFLVPSPIKEYLAFTYEDWKDKTKRDHGMTYYEMHPEHTDDLKNIMDKDKVFYAIKKDEDTGESFGSVGSDSREF